MKKLIIACTLLLGASTVSFAQDAKTAAPQMNAPRQAQSAEQRADMQTKGLEKRLGATFTKEQHDGVTAANLNYMNATMELRKSGKPTNEGFQALLKTREEAIHKALGTDLSKKYDDMKQHQPQQQQMAKPAAAPMAH